jgi:hypothetical protein
MAHPEEEQLTSELPAYLDRAVLQRILDRLPGGERVTLLRWLITTLRPPEAPGSEWAVSATWTMADPEMNALFADLFRAPGPRDVQVRPSEAPNE